MNTRDLEYLVAVAEELHFGRAAERCNVSQPALSGQLQKLEARLGITVFERTKRSVRLTRAGAEVITHAREVLYHLRSLEKAATTLSDPLAGEVSIGMPLTVGPYLIPLLLPALKAEMPNLRLNFIEDFTDKLEARMAEGDLDLAILATTPVKPRLMEIKLYEEPFWLALPKSHVLARQKAVDLDDIAAEELLLLSDGHCLRDQIYTVCKLDRKSRSTGVEPKTQKTTLSTILSLVCSGAGITLVPAMSLSDSWAQHPGVVVRPEKTGTAGRTIRLIHRKGYHRAALVERLSAVIRSVLPDTVYPVTE